MEIHKSVRRKRNGTTYNFNFKSSHHRQCLRCETNFSTFWVRKLYCSRTCYMTGVQERKKAWMKTAEGTAWVKKYSVDRERKIRVDAILKLGRVCVTCGYTDIRALHIDHVHGDGKYERSRRKQIYRKIVAGEVDLSRYQLLCANCNWIKRLEKNEGSNHEDYNSFLLGEMRNM